MALEATSEVCYTWATHLYTHQFTAVSHCSLPHIQQCQLFVVQVKVVPVAFNATSRGGKESHVRCLVRVLALKHTYWTYAMYIRMYVCAYLCICTYIQYVRAYVKIRHTVQRLWDWHYPLNNKLIDTEHLQTELFKYWTRVSRFNNNGLQLETGLQLIKTFVVKTFCNWQRHAWSEHLTLVQYCYVNAQCQSIRNT